MPEWIFQVSSFSRLAIGGLCIADRRPCFQSTGWDHVNRLRYDAGQLRIRGRESVKSGLHHVVGNRNVEIADGDTLEPAQSARDGQVALIAATIGKVRLIDNMILDGAANSSTI